MSTKKLTLISILLALALIIFIIEAQLPPIAPIPGIKLGLANVITLTTLYMLGRKEAFAVLVLRIMLGSIFTGNFATFMYSFSGGIVCFVIMSIMKIFIKENRMWVVSVLGAIGHNTGQIITAYLIMKTSSVMWYFPILMISAIITGIFTGTAAQVALKRLRKTDILKTLLKENTNA